jgi:pimeloyl-ACP methyl ester carboxylesterase
MRHTRRHLSALVVFAGLMSAMTLAQGPFAFVAVDGIDLHVRQVGSAVPNMPTVVFENGLGTPLVSWIRVQDEIARDTRTITYDRPGLGRSKVSEETPTAAIIARRLHALLGQLGAPPPYVLVGHSYGGPLIQFYAATYPNEVAGLVLVDPTDAAVDMNDVWTKAGAPDGVAWERKTQQQAMSAALPGIQGEIRMMLQDQKDGFSVFRELKVPDVPIGILLAGKLQAPLVGGPFPGNFDNFASAMVAQRVDHFGRLARNSKNGFMTLVGTSDHFIQFRDPDSVVWAIRRVMKAAAPKSFR